MSINKISKFVVIKNDMVDNDVSVLATFYGLESAIGFLNDHIDKNYDINDYLKCFYEKKNTIAIFQYSRIWPKKLILKFQILEYQDE